MRVLLCLVRSAASCCSSCLALSLSSDEVPSNRRRSRLPARVAPVAGAVATCGPGAAAAGAADGAGGGGGGARSARAGGGGGGSGAGLARGGGATCTGAGGVALG